MKMKSKSWQIPLITVVRDLHLSFSSKNTENMFNPITSITYSKTPSYNFLKKPMHIID